MKRRPAGKNIELVKKYLTENGESSAADIAKFGKVRGNIYTTLSKMVSTGLIVKNDKKYKVSSGGETITKKSEPKRDPEYTNPLIRMFEEEVIDIEDGIRALQITRSYMLRRISQIRYSEENSNI